MSQPVTITLEFNDWTAVTAALYHEAGEVAASEARRTGGRGYASGGCHRRVETLHRISSEITARLKESNDDAEHAANQRDRQET